MKRFFMTALCLFVAAGFCFASGGGEKKSASEQTKDEKFIVIKSSAIGGSWYACGAAYAKLISDNTAYVAMNSASPGLTNESIQKMTEGKAQLGVVDALATYQAYKGNDPWEAPVEVRGLFGIWPGVVNVIVNANSNIKNIKDLKGKSIATYVEGEPNGIAFLDLLSWVGVTPETSRIYRIMKNDATRMFIDGSADCLIYAFGFGHAKLKEMTTAREVRFIHCDPEIEKKFMEKYPFYSPVIFGEEFGVEPEKQFCNPYFIIAMNTMPEEQAYELTKVWWENFDFLEEAIPNNVPYINREDPTAGIPIPIHPGAEKYFREKGLIK